MKKSFLIFLTLLLSLFPIKNVSYAQEETGPPIQLVEKFEPHYLEVLQDGILQSGVFITEQDYSFYTNLKIEFNFVQKQLQIYETYSEGLDKIIQDHKALSENILKDVQEVREMVIDAQDSWWNNNKFYIGVAAGAIITGLIIAGANAL